jgi:hypothetical protein
MLKTKEDLKEFVNLIDTFLKIGVRFKRRGQLFKVLILSLSMAKNRASIKEKY